MKAQGLMELLPSGLLNPVEVIKRVLVAQEQPNYEQLLNPQVLETGEPPPPPPDPKLQEMQMKSQLEQQKIAQKGEQDQHKMELDRVDKVTQLQMKAAEHAQDMEHKAQMNNLDAGIAQHKQAIFSAEGRQKLTLKEQESRQKQKQMAQKPAKGGK